MKKEKREEEKSIHLGWSLAEFAGMQGTPFSGCLAKYLQPVVLQLNIEVTTASKIGMVKHLAHEPRPLHPPPGDPLDLC